MKKIGYTLLLTTLLLSNTLTSGISGFLKAESKNENDILKDKKLEDLSTEKIKKDKLAALATSKKIAEMEKKMMNLQKNLSNSRSQINLLGLRAEENASILKNMRNEEKEDNKIKKDLKLEKEIALKINNEKLAYKTALESLDNVEDEFSELNDLENLKLGKNKTIDLNQSSTDKLKQAMNSELNTDKELEKDALNEMKTEGKLKMEKKNAAKTKLEIKEVSKEMKNLVFNVKKNMPGDQNLSEKKSNIFTMSTFIYMISQAVILFGLWSVLCKKTRQHTFARFENASEFELY